MRNKLKIFNLLQILECIEVKDRELHFPHQNEATLANEQLIATLCNEGGSQCTSTVRPVVQE